MKHQIKSTIQLRDVNHRLDHLKSCVVQGSVFRLPSFKGEDIWSKVVSLFNDKVFSFVINSIQDVLPHNVNLSRWRKSDTKKCPLCSSDQTLMHVLNNCSVSVKTNRYTWRHNAVLAALVDYIERNLAVSWQLCADLPGRRYSLPYEMGDITTARPDIFAWSTMQKQVVMFELTIPFGGKSPP